MTRTPPAVAPLKPGKLPAVVDTTLPNGLRIIAARKPGVPMVQARLRIDVSRSKGWDSSVLADVVDSTILSGTATRSQMQIAEELQSFGAVMSTSVDVEDFYLIGTTLADELPHYLALLADVLYNATYPQEEVDLVKSQLEQGLTLARSQPAVLAQYAIHERVFPGHVYGRPMPTPDMVAAIARAEVRKYHRTVVSPGSAMLVLVGDLTPSKMVSIAAKALGDWKGTHKPGVTPTPGPVVPGPLQIVHHAGAVQSNLRVGGIGVGRTHPDHPALALALTVLGGGGLTSRLNTNLREDKGYTYGAYMGATNNLAATMLTASADVQTDVTAAALVELYYELGRIATKPATEEELGEAKRYMAGTLALSVETQAGLATYLTILAVAGLDISYLKTYPAALNALTADDVLAAAATYLAPAKLAPVLVGDADLVTESVSRLFATEVVA